MSDWTWDSLASNPKEHEIPLSPLPASGTRGHALPIGENSGSNSFAGVKGPVGCYLAASAEAADGELRIDRPPPGFLFSAPQVITYLACASPFGMKGAINAPVHTRS